MRVLFDFQAFVRQRFGGVSRYFSELIATLDGDKDNDVDVQLGVWACNNFYLEELGLFSGPSLLKSLRSRRRDQLLHLANAAAMRWRMRSTDFDVFHPTHYSGYFLKGLGGRPFVVTIHDMIHEKFPAYYPENDGCAEEKSALIKGAGRIIAVSENTKRDLMEALAVDPARVDVIYHGAPESAIASRRASFLPERYVLFVGRRALYKNFEFFLRAVAGWMKEKDFHVVCCGGGGFDGGEESLLDELSVRGRVHQVSASDEELASAYTFAACFIFPSLYEGFGLPILEAFSFRCPALLADSSCFPEVAGDGAMYFNPSVPGSLLEGLDRIVFDEAARTTLIERATRRLSLFSWEKASKETASCYRRCLYGGN